MIRLERMNGKNVWDILKLHVAKGQESFVAPNDVSIVEAYIAITHHGKAFPFGIYDDVIPIGFCMIGFGKDDDWENAPAIAKGNYNLWRFMIDERYQRKGYGKAAMQKIMEFISDEPCGPAEYCWLSYEPENEKAKSLYASFGFCETGEMDGEEVIAALKLHSQRPAVFIRYAVETDKAFWFSLDQHLSEEEYARKVRDRMGYVLMLEEQPTAILRYSLFWDSIPFCNLLYVKNNQQHKGYGRRLMEYWEADMIARGYDLVMTSTQSDEEAQHFYRKLGYKDCGGLTLPFPGHEQPMELILAKALVIGS